MEIERVIGKLEEFMDWSKREILEIKNDVKHLRGVYFKISGGAMVVSLIVTVLFQTMIHIWR